MLGINKSYYVWMIRFWNSPPQIYLVLDEILNIFALNIYFLQCKLLASAGICDLINETIASFC